MCDHEGKSDMKIAEKYVGPYVVEVSVSTLMVSRHVVQYHILQMFLSSSSGEKDMKENSSVGHRGKTMVRE
jgi:hypothetical protein